MDSFLAGDRGARPVPKAGSAGFARQNIGFHFEPIRNARRCITQF